MSVIDSQLHLRASHSFSQTRTSHSILEINGQTQGSSPLPEQVRPPALVNISNQARELANNVDPLVGSDLATTTAGINSLDDAPISDDPSQQLLIALIEYLTGEPVKLLDTRDLQKAVDQADLPAEPASSAPVNSSGDQPEAFSFYYEETHRFEEYESTSFQASGVIQTSDGKQISFAIDLSMERSYVEESRFVLEIGEPRKREDPLVINFSGTAAQLQSQRFTFDLKADGNAIDIPLLAPGSGYLVFDRNNDQIVNDGSELFGTLSGDAYADLAALDTDGNEWIDRNDAAFKHLLLWLPDTDGNGKLLSLEEAGVAAVSTANIATPFELRGSNNSDLGAVRATGL